MQSSDAKELISDSLLPEWGRRLARLDIIDGWVRWSPDDIRMPRRASTEQKQLRDMSRTPYLGLVVTSLSQTLAVDGYRQPTEMRHSGPWATWRANGMPARQLALHRAVLTFGDAYLVVMPGRDGDGPRSVMRPVSPRRMVAVYDDATQDDWPRYAVDFRKDSKGTITARLYDDEVVHEFTGPEGALVLASVTPHDAGVPPVIRYQNAPDLEGRTTGEVEPLIPTALRVNKTIFDRLVTQHHNSWKVWTATGLDLTKGPQPEQGTGDPAADAARAAEQARIRLRQGDLLTAASSDVKFGALPESSLDGFIKGYESDLRELAAAAQLPPAFFGDISNISAEALAMLQHGLEARSAERRLSLGESHAQSLRMAAQLEGRAEDAADYLSEITWQDTSIRSMAQAVDALGKAAQLLRVPPEALWGKIPGVTRTEVDEWREITRSADPVETMRRDLAATAVPDDAAQ